MLKRLLRWLFMLAFLAACGGGAVWWFMHAGPAKRMAAGKLSAALGLNVQVDELNVGLKSSALAFRVVGADGTEVLRVTNARADVPLADLVSGRAEPKELHFTGVRVRLDLDREGKLLTKLPDFGGTPKQAQPRLHFDDVALTVKQDGRPEFQVSNTTLRIEHGTAWTWAGDIRDPHWGQWQVSGGYDPTGRAGELVLNTTAGTLDIKLLRSLPVVPPGVWDHVGAAGVSPMRVALSTRPERAFAYEVTLTPTGQATVDIPDIGVKLDQVVGTIVVQDACVNLNECRSRLAGGGVSISGDLDFRPETSVLNFRVNAQEVDVRGLPESWAIPRVLDLRLRGTADLNICVPPVGPNDYGGGGTVRLEAKRVPAAGVALRLRSERGRYVFERVGPF